MTPPDVKVLVPVMVVRKEQQVVLVTRTVTVVAALLLFGQKTARTAKPVQSL
jgi:hypothetical protein